MHIVSMPVSAARALPIGLDSWQAYGALSERENEVGVRVLPTLHDLRTAPIEYASSGCGVAVSRNAEQFIQAGECARFFKIADRTAERRLLNVKGCIGIPQAAFSACLPRRVRRQTVAAMIAKVPRLAVQKLQAGHPVSLSDDERHQAL